MNRYQGEEDLQFLDYFQDSTELRDIILEFRRQLGRENVRPEVFSLSEADP